MILPTFLVMERWPAWLMPPSWRIMTRTTPALSYATNLQLQQRHSQFLRTTILPFTTPRIFLKNCSLAAFQTLVLYMTGSQPGSNLPLSPLKRSSQNTRSLLRTTKGRCPPVIWNALNVGMTSRTFLDVSIWKWILTAMYMIARKRLQTDVFIYTLAPEVKSKMKPARESTGCFLGWTRNVLFNAMKTYCWLNAQSIHDI